MERPCCRLCLYHRPRGNRCRRYPPQSFYDIQELTVVTRWPKVNPDMWCGEFKDWTDEDAPPAGADDEEA